MQVTDPVGAGFVESLARPGGNATGFTQFEYGISAKWLELLKEIAPSVTRAAVLRDPANAAGIGQFAAIQAVAPSLGVELRPIGCARRRRDRARHRRLRALSERRPDRDWQSHLTTVHRDLIITLAAQHQLPAVYPFRFFVAAAAA